MLALVGVVDIYDSLRIEIPFVRVRKRAFPDILRLLDLKRGSVLCDLGCGDARFLLSAIKETEGVSGIGYEKRIITYCLAKLKTRDYPIDIHFDDIMKANLSDVTHIFCYLSNEMMQKLEKKIQSECRAGVKIVSCDFECPTLISKKIIELNAGTDKLAKKLFLYEI